jgi:hypothetical protein
MNNTRTDNVIHLSSRMRNRFHLKRRQVKSSSSVLPYKNDDAEYARTIIILPVTRNEARDLSFIQHSVERK